MCIVLIVLSHWHYQFDKQTFCSVIIQDADENLEQDIVLKAWLCGFFLETYSFKIQNY